MSCADFLCFATLWIAGTAVAWLTQHWPVPLAAAGLVVLLFTKASPDRS